MRPGRFDRVVFVPPPDYDARVAILRIHLRGKPTTDLDLPRLARQMDMFCITDGRFAGDGRFLGCEVPGAGDVQLDRAIELLKGVCFQGWLMFEWPRTAASPPEPEQEQVPVPIHHNRP